MAEYLRTKTHQYCDTELCFVIDTHTGEIVRIFGHNSAVGEFKEALDWLVKYGSKQRNAIVKITCVGAFPLRHNMELTGGAPADQNKRPA